MSGYQEPIKRIRNRKKICHRVHRDKQEISHIKSQLTTKRKKLCTVEIAEDAEKKEEKLFKLHEPLRQGDKEKRIRRKTILDRMSNMDRIRQKDIFLPLITVRRIWSVGVIVYGVMALYWCRGIYFITPGLQYSNYRH